jgi:CRISPR/Cas system-associated exonuclease Cas4 (RecB family)
VPFVRTPESAGTKYPVWGSIDAVFWAKDFSHHRFVDWKSGSKKQDNSNQLHHYMFGFNADTRVEGNYHHLDRVQKPSIVQEMEPYPGDDVVRNRILKTERMKESVVGGERAPKFAPDWYCNYCPVQEFCPEEGDWRNRLASRKKLDAMLPLATPLVQF